MMNGEKEFEELRRAHERLETRVDTILPTLVTKADLAEGLRDVREGILDEVRQLERRMTEGFERMYLLLVRVVWGALILVLTLFGALLLRQPAPVAPGPGPAVATALPAGTTFVLTIPPIVPVAPAPHP